jgi:phosphoglycolate phosphatase
LRSPSSGRFASTFSLKEKEQMKLVIFDVDGTLVDSQDFIVEAQTRAFTALGLVPPPRETMLSIVGLSLVRAFEVLVPGGPA